MNLYIDRIISYVNKRRSTRQDGKAQETQTRIESKEQLQDILKSMENLFNHGPGPPSHVFFRSSSPVQRSTDVSTFKEIRLHYGKENICSNCN